MDNTFTSYKMEERSYVSYIKREIHNRIARTHFSQHQAGKVDIIVSELATNIIKHAGGGELLVRIEDTGESTSRCEIISIDNGPGIADTAKMLRDGVSTTSTLGQGLGAVNRLSNVAQLYSIPGWGTVHYAMITSKEKTPVSSLPIDLDIRAVCVNKPREDVCGDGYRVKQRRSTVSILFGDGLGHGIHAEKAMDTASDFFFETKEEDPVAMIRLMHERVRRTRGLVAAIATCDLARREWRICGVGNISTRLYTGLGYKNYMSYNGTIGLTIPGSMNASSFPLEANQHLIMCSDGIQTRWDLSRFPAILKYDNTILASAIYKDYKRGTDDASVLVAKVI